ncbi:MAG: 30S ribosomal protein S17 [Acidimicrobiia bacterium]|nr:MAG: 30S ribosomal protein S17 [Acidimicrobiia bacterium]
MTDTPDRNRRKSRVGVVVSDGADKTIAVEIQLSRAHPKYGKVVRKNRKLQAHDEANDARVGDTVRIVETRPLSKTKRWRLDEVLERAR